MFARFFLGDLFIHGIGGAKYDELGDEIARRFLGIEPPGFLTLSLTLWLGLPTEPVTPDDLAAVDRALRDLRFNPDRHLHEPYPEELRRLISAKREAIAGPVTSRRERVARAKAIRRYNEAMQPWVEAMRADLVSRRLAIRAGLRSNRIARNREYASVLHSGRRLREVLPGIGGAMPAAGRALGGLRRSEAAVDDNGLRSCAGAAGPSAARLGRLSDKMISIFLLGCGGADSEHVQ